MGASDVVPGVSGGTIALIFGIYEALVHAVHEGARALGHFAKADFRGGMEKLKSIDWMFLLPLGAGIVVAVASLASLIDHLLENQPVRMTSLFFGLVLASIVIAWTHLRNHDATRYGVLVASGIVTFLLMGLKSAEASAPSLLVLFIAGAVAITAMILPGISGSFILLMFGLYDYVISAVSDRDLTVVVVFGTGAILGLAVFSSLLDWLLERHHDTVMAALIGLMAGSLRILWPWPEGIEEASLGTPTGELLIPALLCAGAAVLVLTLGLYGRHHEKKLAAAKSHAEPPPVTTTSAPAPAPVERESVMATVRTVPPRPPGETPPDPYL